MCRGAEDYQRAMYAYELLLLYWERNGMPIMELLKRNPTMFSEESGEVALSALASLTPSSARGDLEQTRQQWQLIKLKYEQQHPRHKKYRILSKSSHSSRSAM